MVLRAVTRQPPSGRWQVEHMPATVVPDEAVVRQDKILTDAALKFVADLQRRFGARRDELIEARKARRQHISEAGRLDLLAETRGVRESELARR